MRKNRTQQNWKVNHSFYTWQGIIGSVFTYARPHNVGIYMYASGDPRLNKNPHANLVASIV